MPALAITRSTGCRPVACGKPGAHRLGIRHICRHEHRLARRGRGNPAATSLQPGGVTAQERQSDAPGGVGTGQAAPMPLLAPVITT